jgi:hypothetical protein
LSALVASPPNDLARQIAAVTQDLAGLRAEEQRLMQVQMQSRTVPLHQRVRCTTIVAMLQIH